MPELLALLKGDRARNGDRALPPRPRIIRGPELDPQALRSPWLDGILKPLRSGCALWELERGCPYACSYCFESKGSRRVRRIDRGRIEAELALFVRSGVEELTILSPTFNADRARALDLLALFRKKGRGLSYSMEIRAESLDREQAHAFAAIGAKLQLGLQSADPEVCAKAGRKFDPELFKRKVALLDAEGIIFGLDLIYGLPGDDLPRFRSSLDYALELRPNHLDVFRLSVLPGTRLHEEAPASGLSWDPEPPYLLRSSPGYRPEDLAIADELALAAEIFYNRGRSVAWFLPLCKALGLKPSEFLAEVARSVAGRGDKDALMSISDDGEFDSARVIAFQLDFIRVLCAGKREALLPLAVDLASLHGAYGRAVAEGLSTELDLSYDPDESLSPMAEDFRRFVQHVETSPRRVRVAPDGQGDAGIEEL